MLKMSTNKKILICISVVSLSSLGIYGFKNYLKQKSLKNQNPNTQNKINDNLESKTDYLKENNNLEKKTDYVKKKDNLEKKRDDLNKNDNLEKKTDDSKENDNLEKKTDDSKENDNLEKKTDDLKKNDNWKKIFKIILIIFLVLGVITYLIYFVKEREFQIKKEEMNEEWRDYIDVIKEIEECQDIKCLNELEIEKDFNFYKKGMGDIIEKRNFNLFDILKLCDKSDDTCVYGEIDKLFEERQRNITNCNGDAKCEITEMNAINTEILKMKGCDGSNKCVKQIAFDIVKQIDSDNTKEYELKTLAKNNNKSAIDLWHEKQINESKYFPQQLSADNIFDIYKENESRDKNDDAYITNIDTCLQEINNIKILNCFTRNNNEYTYSLEL